MDDIKAVRYVVATGEGADADREKPMHLSKYHTSDSHCGSHAQPLLRRILLAKAALTASPE